MKRSTRTPSTSASTNDVCPYTGSARDFFPQKISLTTLLDASKTCRGCDLYCNATQTVFGAGPADATLMLVGEQPGDQEDIAGKPFVGPAGRLLDETLEQAAIDRSTVYVTNAVKHFKFEQRGKRRIHGKPNARQINACRPWLEAEIREIRPKMIVCMGATAAQALLGKDFRVTKHRGEVIEDQPWAPWLLATVHPSSLLRMPDPEARAAARAAFVDDFKIVAKQLKAEGHRAKLRLAAHAHVRDSADAHARRGRAVNDPDRSGEASRRHART
jgi:uracil-DNA glycosylase family protein